MDEIDFKILAAINTVSPRRFVSPVRVNEVLQLNETELGNRLMLMKRSGHLDIMTSEYASSLTLPNAISRVCLTELGQESLKEKH